MGVETIKLIQKKIIVRLEKGEDVSELTEQLAQERAKIAAEAEVEELKKKADERRQLREQAAELKAKIEKHTEAIAVFLKARDVVVGALLPVLEQAKELPKLQGACDETFSGPGQLAHFQTLPEGYLPKELTVPFLESMDGVTSCFDRAAEGAWYLSAGLGLLQSLISKDRPIPTRPAEEFEAVEPELGQCNVCAHPDLETINAQLRQGTPLRDIERQFSVSRSSLSRHKNSCFEVKC